MTDYLPKDATIEQACNWLQAKTGETWILPRLLECHLWPYFWLDYAPGNPAIFGNRMEGFQSCMMFQGDLCRLESDGADALVNYYKSHDGSLLWSVPGLRVPLSDLRFKRDDVERVAEIINKQKTAPAQSPATPVPVVAALVEPTKAGPVPVATRAMADSFAGLHWDGEQWIKRLGDKPVWLDACMVLNRGRGEGPRLWNPVLIGSYLVRMRHAKTNSVRARFQTQPALIPWLDEWRTYEADNHPTD